MRKAATFLHRIMATGEPDDAKVSCPVRRGAGRKGGAIRPRWRPTLPRYPPRLKPSVIVETAPSRELLEAMDLWSDHTLLGLYQGVPLPERGHNYGSVLPDQITIFQQPIEALYRTPEEIQEAVRETVIHEVGHYFGLDDERIDELMEP